MVVSWHQKSVISGFEEIPRVDSENDRDPEQDDEESSQIPGKFSKEISSSSEPSFRPGFLPAIIQVIIRTIKRIKYKFQTYLSYLLTLLSFNSENISIVLLFTRFFVLRGSSRWNLDSIQLFFLSILPIYYPLVYFHFNTNPSISSFY